MKALTTTMALTITLLGMACLKSGVEEREVEEVSSMLRFNLTVYNIDWEIRCYCGKIC